MINTLLSIFFFFILSNMEEGYEESKIKAYMSSFLTGLGIFVTVSLLHFSLYFVGGKADYSSTIMVGLKLQIPEMLLSFIIRTLGFVLAPSHLKRFVINPSTAGQATAELYEESPKVALIMMIPNIIMLSCMAYIIYLSTVTLLTIHDLTIWWFIVSSFIVTACIIPILILLLKGHEFLFGIDD